MLRRAMSADRADTGAPLPDLNGPVDPTAPLRLLLVEDEPTQLLILAHKLRQAGYVVDTATNGRQALDKLQVGGYSLLLTDWDMPLMDGVELCRALRAAQLPNYVFRFVGRKQCGQRIAVIRLSTVSHTVSVPRPNTSSNPTLPHPHFALAPGFAAFCFSIG